MRRALFPLAIEEDGHAYEATVGAPARAACSAIAVGLAAGLACAWARPNQGQQHRRHQHAHGVPAPRSEQRGWLGWAFGGFGGRKLTDDVVDTGPMAIFGGLLSIDLGNVTPGLTTDNVDSNDATFLSTFPTSPLRNDTLLPPGRSSPAASPLSHSAATVWIGGPLAPREPVAGTAVEAAAHVAARAEPCPIAAELAR